MKKLTLLLLLPALALVVRPVAATRLIPAATACLAAERQPRPVAPFTAVEAAGSMQVVLRQGSPQRVEVEALAADQAKVETEVRGGSLRVGRRREGRNMLGMERFEGPVTVYITVPSLTALSLSGSGDLRVDGPVQASDFKVSVAGSGNLTLPQLTAQNLQTSLAGSGNVVLGGSCPRHEIRISGSGNVKAADLRTADTRISIGGSGDATVQATKTLTSSIAGSGNVRYSGSPQLTSSKSGSGSVQQL